MVSETRQLVALSKQALARGERLCLATVVHIEGSAYRKPGARMLVTSGGQRAGTISGGCLEAEVGRKAWWLTARGARVERYSSFVEEDGSMPYGLGCGGTVSLLLEQGEAAEAVLGALERVLETREPAVVIMALGRALQAVGAGTQAGREAGDEGAPRRQTPGEPIEQMPGVAAAGGMFEPGTGTLAVWTSGCLDGQPDAAGPCYWNEAAVSAMTQRAGSASAGAASARMRAGLAQAAARALSGRHSLLLDAWLRECSSTRPGAKAVGEPGEDPADPVAERAPAYFVQYLGPPPALSIFGAGDDAQPLAALADSLGWRVSVLDGRAHLARRERFPQAADVHVIDYADPDLRASCGMAHAGTAESLAPLGRLAGSLSLNGPLPDEAVVVLTHSYEQDRALLLALLPQPLRYLGILGPRHRTERLLAEVTPLLGLSIEEGFALLHSPMGLDLGAGDPATVALSIIAEVQAVLHGRRVVLGRAGSGLGPGLGDAGETEPTLAGKRGAARNGPTAVENGLHEGGEGGSGEAVLAAHDLA